MLKLNTSYNIKNYEKVKKQWRKDYYKNKEYYSKHSTAYKLRRIKEDPMFKLIHILGSLLERPIIHNDFKTKYSIILQYIDCEMDEAKEIFDQQMQLQEVN